MVLVVTVLPFPAASLIWTGYMECIQLSSGSFVREELHKCMEDIKDSYITFIHSYV